MGVDKMKFAQRKDGSFVYAVDIANNGVFDEKLQNTLFCPYCKQAVFLKMGKETIAHFAHYASNNDQHNHINESDIHYSQKIGIYDQLKVKQIEGQLEYEIESRLRRADIFVGRQPGVTHELTIELQYSPISSEAVFKREEDYQKVGVRVLWLLGYQSNYQQIFKAKDSKVKASHLNTVRPFLKYQYDLGFYLPFWQEEFERVLLLSIDLYGRPVKQTRLSIGRYIDHFNQNFEAETGDFLANLILQKDTPVKSLPPKNITNSITKILVNPTKSQQNILSFLYQNQMYLQDFPHGIFAYQNRSIFARVADWQIVIVYLVVKANYDDKSDQEVLNDLFHQLTNLQFLVNHPLFTKEIILSWLLWFFSNYEDNR